MWIWWWEDRNVNESGGKRESGKGLKIDVVLLLLLSMLIIV